MFVPAVELDGTGWNAGWLRFPFLLLLEQLEHALGLLVGLGEHRLGGLGQHVHLGVLHHLFRHIGVADPAVGAGHVLGGDIEVVDGVLETVYFLRP